MNRDDVIRWAREAGLERVVELQEDGTRTTEILRPDSLARFATLVAAAEREECARVCERERAYSMAPYPTEYTQCAAAIRARGQQ